MGLNLHFQEVKSFQKGMEKNPTRYKRAFFLIIFTHKKKSFRTQFFNCLQGVQFFSSFLIN